ncbi:MAG TPA: hypothetical protein VKV26_16305 [Dehalococcoidia bacterium]|nr:hypothetical protein [Dehalococcoidia bacterium]
MTTQATIASSAALSTASSTVAIAETPLPSPSQILAPPTAPSVTATPLLATTPTQIPPPSPSPVALDGVACSQTDAVVAHDTLKPIFAEINDEIQALAAAGNAPPLSLNPRLLATSQRVANTTVPPCAQPVKSSMLNYVNSQTAALIAISTNPSGAAQAERDAQGDLADMLRAYDALSQEAQTASGTSPATPALR